MARSILPSLAALIPSLRYFNLNVFGYYGEPPVHGTLFHSIKPRDYWWRFDVSRGERRPEPIDAVIGRGVAEHLRSPKYDYSKPIEGTEANRASCYF